MRIAIGSDERTHLTDLLIAELRAATRWFLMARWRTATRRGIGRW